MTAFPPDADATDFPRIPDGPFLSQLAGAREAREWGESLAHDLALYRNRKLAWSEIDRGCVLHGPPGTGKTTIARAIAATARVPLVATSYAEWCRGQYVADILAPMKAAFRTAATFAPCILAIDEIDSLPRRDELGASSASVQMIVNALLELLDGFHRQPGVVVIGTCNHADKLDPALVRPGRLDRQILVSPPELEAIPQILAYHIGPDADTFGDLKGLAVACAGMTGAALEQLVRDARREARRFHRKFGRADLLAVLDAGSKKDLETRWRIAVHETGHAVAACRLGGATNISLSLLARGGIGGRTVITSRDEALTRARLESKIAVLLAGRAAEELIVGSVSAGAGGDAHSDLGQATDLARSAVLQLGLSRSGSLMWHRHPPGEGAGGLRSEILAEVEDLLAQAYEAAKGCITAHVAQVERIAKTLLQQRSLAHDDFVRLLG